MAQPPHGNLPGEFIEHRYFDNGETIATVTYSKVMEQRGTGLPSTVTRGDSFRTVDGILFNPIYATGQTPLLLAVCHVCRHPPLGIFLFRKKPTHGICTLQNARQCHDCGTTCCPAHRVNRQGKAFCLRCARRRRIWKLIKPLFFKRVDE